MVPVCNFQLKNKAAGNKIPAALFNGLSLRVTKTKYV